MKSKLIIAALLVLAATLVLPALARAQEGEPVVVDEVIAQVNDGIVTLSQLKREMKERVEHADAKRHDRAASQSLRSKKANPSSSPS